ncbi:MFS transporter [Facklamia sp. DSM 111018]|uniref:MFS transporter n=1 Tax=Facklamia lactis TaxID=2749967 RepID=A0ABS0LMW1_9LACT|nr:MFS transporter [Facklamia lactis]MBG9979858.1 MFS transporter [Facklamia lactis]MBG9985462.1 MFS transporter [Facklamia lactis]
MINKIKSTYSRDEFSWILQDWANSAYSLMITTAVFPILYKEIANKAEMTDANSTAYLGYVNAAVTIAVALMAPLLGSLADFPGLRKKMFTIATMAGVLSVLSMAFISYSWQLLLALYLISAIGFGAANIFYDASLMDVTSKERFDLVSSAGFGFGYIGSVIPFLIFMIFQFGKLLPTDLNIKLAFILTAIWWFVFTIPYWRNVKQSSFQKGMNNEKQGDIIRSSWQSVKVTIQEIRKYHLVLIFLLAYFFYIDGVGTIIKMATSVGTDLGLSPTELIIMLLIVQVVAFPCTLLYGVLAKRYSASKMLFVGIFTYIIICVMALRLSTFKDFIMLAILVGTAQGGIQSLSRSYFANLIPDQKSNQFFGFYNIFGKFSSVLGTTTLAIVSQLTGDSLKGLFAIIGQFILGAGLLWMVQSKRTKSKNNPVSR